MYSAFIVDDEEMVVERIRLGIPWREFGFAVCGWAFGGEEALRKIDELNPDIVLTDIRMPKMDGIELLRRIKQSHPNIKCILISGHAEFKYAQEAIKLEADGYCLKPIIDDDLFELLAKTQMKLDQQFWHSAVLSGSYSPDKLKSFISSSGLEPNKPLRVVVGSKEVDGAVADQSIKLYCGKNITASVAQLNGHPLKAGWQEGFKDMKAYAGTAVCKDADGLTEAMLSAYIAFCQHFMMGKYTLYDFPAGTMPELLELLHSEEIHLKKERYEAVQSSINRILPSVGNGRFHIRHALIVYNFLRERLKLDHLSEINDEEELMHTFSSFSEMMKELGNGLDLPEENSSQNTQINMQQVMEYVNTNYTQPLTLGMVGAKFHINTSYLCRLFSKHNGISFSKHMRNLRIQFSCVMLESTDETIQNIADSCGFENYFYFAKMFKQTMGCTPTQYRQKGSKKNADAHIASARNADTKTT